MSDQSSKRIRGIYKITNEINGKCYIGKSEDLGQRIRNHIKMIRGFRHRNVHLENAIEKYGVHNFSIEILEFLEENDDINEKEKHYIELYKSYDREYGYNLTKGGDGGNSYVDCITDEEKENHYKKHREIRTRENNPNYRKVLYTDGIASKYITNEEIPEYEKMGWKKGATDKFKEDIAERMKGENNPFYGKHHLKESIEKAKQTKKERGLSSKGRISYHKDGKTIRINPEEKEKYELDGWILGIDPIFAKNMKESKLKNWNDSEWIKMHRKNMCNHYQFDGVDIYGKKELIKYIKEHGFPDIGERSIKKIIAGENTTNYPELKDRIIKIEKENEL